MYRIKNILITFVLLLIHFVFSTNFIIANGFDKSYSLRSGLVTINEVGFFIMEQLKLNLENEVFENTKIIGIYKITSPTNKIYIGKSTNCNQRKVYYRRSACKTQTKLLNSLKKYGWKKHRFEIIKKCNKNELDYLEIYYIKLFKSFNTKNGMNLASGGNSPLYSEITKKRMSIMKLGTKHTEETKKKMSNAHKGLNTWSKNTTHSQETKKKMSNTHKCINKWWLKGISRNYNNGKKVIDIKTGIIYNKLTEAANKNNIKISTLCNMLKGRRRNKTNLKYYNNEKNSN